MKTSAQSKRTIKNPIIVLQGNPQRSRPGLACSSNTATPFTASPGETPGQLQGNPVPHRAASGCCAPDHTNATNHTEHLSALYSEPNLVIRSNFTFKDPKITRFPIQMYISSIVGHI